MTSDGETWTVTIAGQRLDAIVAEHACLSRAQAQAAIAEGRVLLDSATTKPGQRPKPGQTVTYVAREPEPISTEPEPIPLAVVYEDHDLIVVNKPAGMVTHPARGSRSGTLVNALLAHCTDLSGIGGRLRPGIVHRLDKETSGLLVVAKHDAAHHHLAAQIQARTAGRRYLALAWGNPAFEETCVDAPLGRHRHRRLEQAVRPDGRPALTHLRVLERFAVAALLQARLETGRTHQVRVHCAYLGHPLLGDRLYGTRGAGRAGSLPEPAASAVAALGGQALCAAELDFAHPADGRPMRFAIEPPAEFRALHEALRAL